MKKDLKKLFKNRAILIGCLFIFILVNYTIYLFRYIYQGDVVSAFNDLFSYPAILLSAFPLSINLLDLTVSFLISTMFLLIMLDKKNNKKKFRKGSEYGSARWGNFDKDLEGMYDSKKQYNNILFSKNTKLALNDSDIDFNKRRNKNVVVFGGSGSGKTRTIIKPNISQMNCSFVCTDPKGTILNEVGDMLKNFKYNIKVFNTVDFDKSMKYNPLKYVKKEQDILKLVETIIANTSGDKAGAEKHDFWVKSEKLLYQAYLSLILMVFPEDQKHLGTLIDLVSESIVNENDETFKNAIDLIFEGLEEIEEYRNSFAVKQYKAFKLAAGKTAKSILISCATRLAPLNIPDLRNLISSDEIELDKIGSEIVKRGNKAFYRKNALFVIVPDTDATFNFLVAIMYTQLFNLLCTIADNEFRGSLPVHVRFLLDEFANIGLIPNFEKLIATIRSRNISATIILQTLSQLKSIYKEDTDTIIGNCDTSIFLGGKEKGTIDMLNEQLGKETIDDYNVSRSRSQSDSFSQSYSKLARDLMTKDELQTMDKDDCIVQILGKYPFKDKKYPLEDHPRYRQHYSKTNNNWYDIAKETEIVRFNKSLRSQPTFSITSATGKKDTVLA